MSGVVTVTAAPSLDRTYHVDSLIPGEVHRAHLVTEEFAGKGVNVSHGLALAGVPTKAVVPLPSELWSHYGHEREWLAFSPSTVSPRVSITVLDSRGETTKINQAAPSLSPDDWSALVSLTGREVRNMAPRWLAMCGALPGLTSGADVDITEVADVAHGAGAFFALDTSGPPLNRWVLAGVPDLVKPNATELAECVGRDVTTLGDVVDAALEVRDWGIDYVVVSLGGDGMVGVHKNTVVHAVSRPVTVRNTIGAGDASLAGFLAHLVGSPDDFPGAIANAVAWGGAKVSQPTSQLSDISSTPELTVSSSVDSARPLSEPAHLDS